MDQRFYDLIKQTVEWFQKLAWVIVDAFIPEAREGYPYIMWDVLATLNAQQFNVAYPAASFSNPTADELVVDYFRIEAAPAATWLAAGGLGLNGGANDYIVRITVKDLAHNAPLMQQSVPIGLLIEPMKRVWKPTRKIVLPGGSQSALQILVDNVSPATNLVNVYVAAHCHARTRKNTPQ